MKVNSKSFAFLALDGDALRTLAEVSGAAGKRRPKAERSKTDR